MGLPGFRGFRLAPKPRQNLLNGKLNGSSSFLVFLRTLGASAKTKTRATLLPSIEIGTSQQLLLSRLPLGFAAFDQRPCFLPDTRSWRFMPAPKVRKNL